MQDNSNFKAGIENFSFSNLANSRASFSMQGRNIWFWLSAPWLLVTPLPVLLLLLLTLLSRTIIRSKPYGKTNGYKHTFIYLFIYVCRKQVQHIIQKYLYFLGFSCSCCVFPCLLCFFFWVLFSSGPKATKKSHMQTNKQLQQILVLCVWKWK